MSSSTTRHICVLDFEATCWDRTDEHEVIEFPSVLIDLETNQIIDKFQTWVKPKLNPIVSDFCFELTGITQEQVNGGVPFPEALKAHQRWLAPYHPVTIVTCGDWDLRTMLPIESKIHRLQIPAIYTRWLNIKREFERQYGAQRSGGMVEMLNALNLELEGRHHSGIDDCGNIARILMKMRSDGWAPA